MIQQSFPEHAGSSDAGLRLAALQVNATNRLTVSEQGAGLGQFELDMKRVNC